MFRLLLSYIFLEEALSHSKSINADPPTNNAKLETTNTDFKAHLEPAEQILVQIPKTTQSKTPEILPVSASLSPKESEVKPLEEDKSPSGAESIISDKVEGRVEPLSTSETFTEENRNILMHTLVSNSEVC